MATSHALVLFAHGARDPEWAEPFMTIRDHIARTHPETNVVLAFLELMEPTLEKAIDALAAKGITRITLVPLFMAQGGHLKEDLPKLIKTIQDSHPLLTFNVTRAIGEVEPILNAIANWAHQCFIANETE